MTTINLLESTMPKKTKKGKRYSPKRRENLLAKFDELLNAGKSTEEAAKEVHVPYQTLHRWKGGSSKPKPAAVPKTKNPKVTTKVKKAAHKRRGRPAGKKARVAVKKAGALTLLTPTGFRIEGISSQELIRVLKALR